MVEKKFLSYASMIGKPQLLICIKQKKELNDGILY